MTKPVSDEALVQLIAKGLEELSAGTGPAIIGEDLAIFETTARELLRFNLSRAWREGAQVNGEHVNNLWRWSAGEGSRRMAGLTEYPKKPDDPYAQDEQ